MPWFKVDDTLAFHAKVLAAGNAAMGLWLRAGSWSAQQLTDGFIRADVARTLGTRAEAQRLVEAGLWVEKEGGYLFHEWEERQPSREDVLVARGRRSGSGVWGNHKRWHIDRGLREEGCPYCDA